MALECVPLINELTGDTKMDAHAIYRRPNGDLTSGLPMRRHHAWLAKGFEYVTLADPASLQLAAPFLQARGLDPNQFVAGIDGDGRRTPWNPAKYHEDTRAQQAAEDAELAALVEKHGIETVEAIRGIRVPDHLRPGYVAPQPLMQQQPDEPEKRRRSPFRSAKVSVQ